MKKLKNFDNFIIEKHLFEEFSLINDEYILNENAIFDKIKNLDKEQLKQYFDKTYALLRNIKIFNVRLNILKLLFFIYVSQIALSGVTTASANDLYSSNTAKFEEIAKEKDVTQKSLFQKFKDLLFSKHSDDVTSDENNIEEISKETYLKDGTDFHVSQTAIDTIKSHEKLKLKAYSIGDGKITIGYGHAEPKKKSKYKLGQTISENEANKLLKADLKVAADGVRRMFSQWKEEGVDIKITQGMFDAMVSIAFNAGVSGLRNSDFIDEVKKGNFLEAAELIPSTRNSGKFKGLNNRRQAQQDLYMDNLENALS